MNLYQENIDLIGQLRPNCKERAVRWMDAAFARGWEFRITETYRSQQRQNELYTIGRRGKQGEKPVTYTRDSKHTQRIALDVYPVTLPDASTIPNFNQRGSPQQIKSRLVAHRLMELQQLGQEFGVYRPPETQAFGDLVHFQIYDLPIPEISQDVLKRRKDREKKKKAEAERIARIVAERRASRLSEPQKSRLESRLSLSPTL